MSFEAQAWARKIKVGNSSRKQVLDCLANCADHNGYCFPSISYITGATELSRNTVLAAISALIDMGLLAKTTRTRENGSHRSNEYQLFLDWQAPPVVAPVLKLVPVDPVKNVGGGSAATALPLVQPLHYPSAATAPLESSKNRNKETPPTPRKRGADGDLPGFERWWQTYPKSNRVSKSKCLRKWRRVGLEERTEQLVRALLADACSDQWLRDGGRFVPMPATWLNQERWDREVPLSSAAEESKLCSVCGVRGIFTLGQRRYCEQHYVEVAA